MTGLIDKISLRNYFSKASQAYESCALLQKRLGEGLLDRLSFKDFYPKVILDIGMGTGSLMQRLAERYYESKIFGLDLSFGMSSVAQRNNLKVLQADAEFLPFKNKSLDLVVSNLVYQWVPNLDIAFFEVNRVLQEKGYFCFSFFGRETLKELRISFSQAKNGRVGCLLKNNFKPVSAEEVKTLLAKSDFKEIEITTKIIKENFKDVFSLVEWLKLIGANRISKPIFMGREIWLKANDFYSRNFKNNGCIYATFEVIEVKARK